jgi:hypothetical protein
MASMSRIGGRDRTVAPAVGVALLIALLGAGLASGAGVGPRAALPPPDSCIAPLEPCYIVLSAASGSAGNSITITGYNFWPGEPFTAYYWNGSYGATAAIVAQGSTGTGGFTATFKVPKGEVGNDTVFVTDDAGDNQSAPFHRTWLHADPTSGAVGATTLVSGQGFLPDHVLRFHIHGTLASVTGVCKTHGDGIFSDCQLTIPSVATGATTLAATDGTYNARVPFDVS